MADTTLFLHGFYAFHPGNAALQYGVVRRFRYLLSKNERTILPVCWTWIVVFLPVLP